MPKLEAEFDRYWRWYGRGGPSGGSQTDIRIFVPYFRDKVREEYSPDSPVAQAVLADLRAGVAKYLDRLTPQLEALQSQMHKKRVGMYALGAGVTGGILGAVIGAGVGGSGDGGSAGAAKWGIVGGVIGAAAGAGLGLIGGAIVNALAPSPPPKKKPDAK